MWIILAYFLIHVQTEREGGNTLRKYKTEDLYASEEDVNSEEYMEVTCPFFHCAHCEYKTNDRSELNDHMEIDHTGDERVPLAEDESFHQEELVNAIEVWKIYKLLQRMKNK